MPSINNVVLMSGAKYFSVDDPINAYMKSGAQLDKQKVIEEHTEIEKALRNAGVKVVKVDPPESCQDGVYTANWGLCRGNKVVVSSLPEQRQPEQAYAKAVFEELGLEIITPPLPFSGQGDALPCGKYLFMGSKYRTDARVHDFVAKALGYDVIGLQTIPQLDRDGKPVTNQLTGWQDSFFYDIDLALAVITPELIAWCPEAFTEKSQAKVRATNLDKIEVSLEEAKQGFACNLVSTGERVIMSARAPQLASELQQRGLAVVTPQITELSKGGGYIRCTTLTLR